MEKKYISDLSKFVGEVVTLHGWVYNTRSSGKIKFLLLRDGTGIVQCVVMKNGVGEEVYGLFDQLTQESSVTVTGMVNKEERAPGGYELFLSDINYSNF